MIEGEGAGEWAIEEAAREGVARERPLPIYVGMTRAEAERVLLLATLDALEGNKRATAEQLGISLKTVYNRLNAYGELP